MYPFSEVEEGLASLMGYPYKCFQRLPKENSQIRMVEDDEGKTRFHTEEGLASISRFILNMAELILPIRKVCQNLDAAERPNWQTRPKKPSEDKKKIGKIANTDHPEGGRSADTLPTAKE
ncbi:hypothetical protein Tco_1348194 [Tanacetum coccineum]